VLRWAVLVTLTVFSAVAEGLPEHVLHLARVNAKVNEALKTVPDYTCLAVTERFRQELRDPAPRPVDVVRMEVAHADHRDLYAWPGATRFESVSAAQMIGAGMYGSGEFASHLSSIFNGYAVMKYVGEGERLGRKVWQWKYSLAQFASNWRVTFASRTAIAGEKGTFWADAETLDIVRVEVRSDGLPPQFPISEVVTTIDYARVRLGPREVLLPQSALTIVTEGFSGATNQNFTEFSHCRQYTTQSDVRYGVDAPAASGPIATTGVKEIAVPRDLRLTVALSTGVDSKKAAVGDPIEAVVTADVFQKRHLVIPKGAVLRGRLRRMDAQEGPPEHFVVGLEFTDLEYPGYHARFFGMLSRVESQVPGFQWLLDSVKVKKTRTGRGIEIVTSGTTYWSPEVPGVGAFLMEGTSFLLPRGMAMTWVTEDVEKK
jgi:hypothetical protein